MNIYIVHIDTEVSKIRGDAVFLCDMILKEVNIEELCKRDTILPRSTLKELNTRELFINEIYVRGLFRKLKSNSK